jgi:hypothetical protein
VNANRSGDLDALALSVARIAAAAFAEGKLPRGWTAWRFPDDTLYRRHDEPYGYMDSEDSTVMRPSSLVWDKRPTTDGVRGDD